MASLLFILFFLSNIVYCVNIEFETKYEETYNDYYNYAQLTSRLQYLSGKYADICSLFSVGKSVEDRALWVMRITTRPFNDTPGKPRFAYVGNMHGEEAVSRQVLVYLIEYILSRYESDPRVSVLVNSTDVYILPSMNPDGFERAVEGPCNGRTSAREHAKHVDLTRSFPEESDPNTLDNAPEVQAVNEWILQKKFVLSGNLHGGSVMASFPFDDSSSHTGSDVSRRTADYILFQNLAQAYAKNHPIMRYGMLQCHDDPSERMINNSATDVEQLKMQGRMQYFSYIRGNCFEITFTISCCKYPIASELYNEWNNNREALLAFMEKVQVGVRGYVMNTLGMGIPGSNISVAGIDHNITTWIFGDYYRLLLPGTYTITASSFGYLPSTVNDVTVVEGRATLLNLILKDASELMTVPVLPTTPVPISTSSSTEEVLMNQWPTKQVAPAQSQHFDHHNYSHMEMFLQQISSIYSAVTYLYSIGQSVLGRELYVMEISTSPGIDLPGKPEIMFVGNLHGSDDVGRETLLNLIEYLCSNFGSDPFITRLLNSTRVHILPSMNPDGLEMASTARNHLNVNRDFSAGVVSTAQTVDLSSNFPDQLHATSLVRRETTAVMHWIMAHSFVLASSVLGGTTGVTYPNPVDSLDEAVFRLIAQAYYMENPSLQMSHGCEVPKPSDKNVRKHNYSAHTGIDLQTWAYRHTDTLGVRIGLSCDLNPLAENLETYWKLNQRALLQFIQQVHFSVTGRVIDAHSGKSIVNATIVVEGAGHKVHTSSTGHYWRLLAQGTYQLHAFAAGYITGTGFVSVSDNWWEQVDFRLTPESLKSEGEKQEEEFRQLIEDLSSAHGLNQFIQSYLPAKTLRYRKHTERSEFLCGLHLNFPQITRLYSLGHSWEFRPIWALEISACPESPRPTDPKIRYVAGVHGNAAVGPELLLEFASVLCINYGDNTVITQLINRSKIIIVPCINPDGRELAEEGKCFSTAGFTNAHDVDLDRDFIYGNLSVQPETRAQMDLIKRSNFSLSVVLDGGALLAAYPYDRPNKPAQDEETLRYLASVYARNHPIMHLGFTGCTYRPEFVPGGILRGADFRSHANSMKDFSLDVGLCPEITVYTGCCLYPPAQQLLSLWTEHRTALFAMLLEIHKGLSGVVRDKDGQPVSDAVIRVNDSVFIHTDLQGFFHKLVSPGTQQLSVQAQGFQDQIMQVNLSSHQKTFPIVVEFSEISTHRGQAVVLAAAFSLTVVLLCFLLAWNFRSVKFNRIRDQIQCLRCRQDMINMEAIVSEKSPLWQEVFEGSESEDDAFFPEQ